AFNPIILYALGAAVPRNTIFRENGFADAARGVVLVFSREQMHLRDQREWRVETFRVIRNDLLVHRQWLIYLAHRLEIGRDRHPCTAHEFVIWVFVDKNLKRGVRFHELAIVSLCLG